MSLFKWFLRALGLNLLLVVMLVSALVVSVSLSGTWPVQWMNLFD